MIMTYFKVTVCVPSYKRPRVETLDYLPYARVYVDHKEYDDYIEANPEGSNIIGVPEGVQGNLCRIRNYILDEEFKDGADAVLIIDDDMKGLYYWEGLEKIKVTAEQFRQIVYKYSIMAMDMGVWFWGVNVNSDKIIYREYTPFSFVSYIGGPFQCFINDGGLRYDENLPLKEDYDMTLQQLKKYRRVLRVNKFFYDVKQSEQSGGCATYRNIEREKQQFDMFQRKWGSGIVRRDSSDALNMKKDRMYEDYNPIIKVPIKGV